MVEDLSQDFTRLSLVCRIVVMKDATKMLRKIITRLLNCYCESCCERLSLVCRIVCCERCCERCCEKIMKIKLCHKISC